MRRIRLTRRAAILGLGAASLAGSLGLGRSDTAPDEKALARVPRASPSWTERVSELHQRLARRDFAGAAASAAYLSDEAFSRADRVVGWWLDARRYYRGLLPRELRRGRRPIWNYQDCAADMFGHFVVEALLIAPRRLDGLREMLAEERALSSGLPTSIYLDSGEMLDESAERRIFGAIEYAKDGLLPVLERIGPTEWLDRMHEVANAVIDASPVESRYGRLPSEGAEKNGEFLQVLARLHRREGDPRYLAAGRAIADAYTQEILPHGGGLPAMSWDFAAGKPRPGAFKLRDHGNEIVAGLGEWIMAEATTHNGQAEKYRPAVEQMMDKLLDEGRDASGFWMSDVGSSSQPEERAAQPSNDNWGYLTTAYVAYALSLPEGSPRRQRYLAEAARAFSSAIEYRGAAWEGGMMDGYADTIEGATYLLPYLHVDGAARWVDEQMGIMAGYQKAEGPVGGTYLDGNFVRTMLLYALFRTQGARPDPWLPGLRLGAISAPDGLHLSLAFDRPWSGRVRFDRNRHRDHLGIEPDYPRLNGWTEWFIAEAGRQYEVTRTAAGRPPETAMVDGAGLIEGLRVELTGVPVVVRIARRG
jgi:hypothetical protein